ncbi:MAG: MEDS domain-containing protein, partial [Chloroflexota bacterium]|nr:MEDS domain-containing protein [Chloroflexota bacterium]
DLDRASVAAESLSSEVASLDATGTIIWANAAWLRAARTESRELLAGCTVGADFLRTSRAGGTAIAQVVANGVAAVIAGERGRFEQELTSVDGSKRWKLQVSPLRGSSRGAVLMRSAITGPQRDAAWDVLDPADVESRLSRLTPRELDVLMLMIRGLNNREIAAELGIAYTTVRSHAQAVIEKLDARSRLQAVARVSRGEVGGVMKRVPLGIADQDIGVPAHIGLFYDAEPDLRLRQLEFLRPAIDDPRQGIVLFGPPGVGRVMLGHLEADLGRSLESEVRSGRLLVAQTDSDPDQLLENIRDALVTLAARGTDGIRFIADVKWGAPGFPMPEDALWVESRVNEILVDTKALVVCAYDVSRLPDRALVYGGLDTHPHVVIGDQLKENPSYLAPADYMRRLLLQLRSSGSAS